MSPLPAEPSRCWSRACRKARTAMAIPAKATARATTVARILRPLSRPGGGVRGCLRSTSNHVTGGSSSSRVRKRRSTSTIVVLQESSESASALAKVHADRGRTGSEDPGHVACRVPRVVPKDEGRSLLRGELGKGGDQIVCWLRHVVGGRPAGWVGPPAVLQLPGSDPKSGAPHPALRRADPIRPCQCLGEGLGQ